MTQILTTFGAITPTAPNAAFTVSVSGSAWTAAGWNPITTGVVVGDPLFVSNGSQIVLAGHVATVTATGGTLQIPYPGSAIAATSQWYIHAVSRFRSADLYAVETSTGLTGRSSRLLAQATQWRILGFAASAPSNPADGDTWISSGAWAPLHSVQRRENGQWITISPGAGDAAFTTSGGVWVFNGGSWVSQALAATILSPLPSAAANPGAIARNSSGALVYSDGAAWQPVLTGSTVAGALGINGGARASSPGALNAPVAGSATNVPARITNVDTNYGLAIGTSAATGAAWLQAMRFDGGTQAYGIDLSPLGGGVTIGGQTAWHAGNFSPSSRAPMPTAGSGVGQKLVVQSALGAAAVLPAGGTWEYELNLYANSGVVAAGFSVAGVAAGGSTVGAALAGFLYLGFATRIA